jgi:pilus assembly protein CpaC
VNKHNEINAGFSWQTSDRATKHGNWLRDLVIALAIALAASILGMIGDAYAQGKSIQISGNNRTVMVTVPIGKSEDVRTDTSFVDVVVGDPDCGRQSADRPRVVNSRQEDRHHPRVGLCRGQEAGRNFRHRSLLRHHAADQRVAPPLPGFENPGLTVNGRIMLSGDVADAATLDKAVTIARQFGPGVINSVSVMSPQQVLLEVRFVEISRTAGRELGVRWNRFCESTITNIGNRVAPNSLPLTAASIATETGQAFFRTHRRSAFWSAVLSQAASTRT